MGDGRSRDLRIKEEGTSLYLLSNEESNDSKHGNMSVSKLSFTIMSEGSVSSLLSKFKRVECSYRVLQEGELLEVPRGKPGEQ